MLVLFPGESAEVPFFYKLGFEYVDPDSEIVVYLKRGLGEVGSIVSGPYVFQTQQAVQEEDGYVVQYPDGTSIERVSEGYYYLRLKVSETIFKGQYTIQITTVLEGSPSIREVEIDVKTLISTSDSDYSMYAKKIVINQKSKYQQTANYETNNVLLIGHTDAIEPYGIQKITSIQEGINLLRADSNSPLLRGMFDAYSCGARDIYLMSAGYMSEYVENVLERNVKKYKDEFNETYSFYEIYFHTLSKCYSIIEEYDYFDYIVPLEVSMIDTNGVNFVRQLGNLCEKIQENTGEVTIGVVGSRTQGMTNSSIQALLNADFDLRPNVDINGFITRDIGKYLVLTYGEIVFSHKQLQISYSSSAAAAMAGMLASTPVTVGIGSQRIFSALSIYGIEPTLGEIKKLNDKKINCVTRGSKSRRFSSSFDVFVSGDYTQSISDSFADSVNVRLSAMIIAEIQTMSRNSIGKFAANKLIAKVESFLDFLKSNDIVRDYKMDALADKVDKGKLYFNISVLSSRTLREVSFNIATGRGA